MSGQREAKPKKEGKPKILASPLKMKTASDNLKPDDLRHLLGSKKPVERNLEDDSDLLLDSSCEDNVDSMSIHADDNDLFDDELAGEDLNSLGKHFSSIRYVVVVIV